MPPITRLICLTLALGTPWASHAQTLREAVEAAWARSSQVRTLEAQRDEVAAQKITADSLFAGAPSIGFGERSDRITDRRGRREIEIELAAPLWLPGQRSARQALVESENSENRAAILSQRLAVAGDVRTAVWAATSAADDALLAQERLSSARRLEDEVARRVKAGDLARSDLLLARNETQSAQTTAIDAEARKQQAVLRYRVLTGLAKLPSGDESVAESTEASIHPRLLAGNQAVERARARQHLIRQSNRDNPEFTVQFARERDDFAAAPRESVRFGVRIPFGTDARNAPLVAAAQTDLVRAETELNLLRATVDAEIQEARIGLTAAEEALRTADERHQTAQENLALSRKGFDLGELPLVQLLRVQALATEAANARLRHRTALLSARSRLNQALGILP